MKHSARILALLVVLSFWCTAGSITCSDDHRGPRSYVSHPGSPISMFNSGAAADHWSEYDSLLYIDSVEAWTFTTLGDSKLLISCRPEDSVFDPVIDLYAIDGVYETFLVSDDASGYFSISDAFNPDALIVLNSTGGPAVYDVVVSSYLGATDGPYTLAIAALPYPHFTFTSRGDGLITSAVAMDNFLTDRLNTDVGYFSVDDDTYCILYTDSLDFDTALELVDLSGATIATGFATGNDTEIDFTMTPLKSGTYIIFIYSGSGLYSGDYTVGIDVF